MRVRSRHALIAGLLLVAAGASAGKAWRDELASRPGAVCTLHFEGATLEGVPQALTQQQMERGLAGRDDVGPGMLFTWPEDDVRMFWMRNTRVPLSVALINAQGVIVQIEHMEAQSDVIHQSRAPVREGLEVARGQFEALGIMVGARLLSRSCAEI